MKAFQFDHFKDFFEYQLKERSTDRNGRKKTTLHHLANKLGYNSPSSLSMIANGTRLPSQALLEALMDEWNINSSERERIRLKVEIEKRARKGRDSFKLLNKLNLMTPYHQIDLKKYHLIRDWYVLVIKVLAGCPDFSEDPAVISQKLRKKISPSQAAKALELLLEAGLLVRDPNTNKVRLAVEDTETTHDIPSEAIVTHHKGMIARSLDALEEQKVSQRQFNSLSLQFDSADLPRAKQRILEFVKQFNQEFSSDISNQVYQLNIQFFEHSNGGTKNDV